MAIQYSDKVCDATGNNPEPYVISGSNNQFSIAVDGGGNQVVSLTSGSRTAAQIVADLSGLTGCTASVCTQANGSNFVRLRTTSALGASSTILFNAPSNNANSTLGFISTTYHGGANVNSNFSGNTKQNIIDGITAALNAAGWVTISGGGTTNCLLQSQMTPNSQNLRMRVRIKDNGNTCAVVSVENVSGSKASTNSTSGGGQLLPFSGKGFKIIANKYQAFVFVIGSNSARDFVSFGTVALPTFLQGQTFEAIWMSANSQSDSGTTTVQSLRMALSVDSNAGGHGNTVQLFNGNLTETTNDQQQGNISLLNTTSSNTRFPGYRWSDGSSFMVDAAIFWGTTVTDEPLARGYLWDAFVTADYTYTQDTLLSSVDSRNWYCITFPNFGISQSLRGQLFIVVP